MLNLLVMQISFAVAPLTMLLQATPVDPADYKDLGVMIGGISLLIAALMWIGSTWLGSDLEGKAQKGVWNVIKGLILLGVSGVLIGSV